MLFGFGRLGGAISTPQSTIYIIAGSATFSMVLEGIYTMAQRINLMRLQGRFLYYAALPISKTAFVMALLFSRLLVVGLPGMVAPLIIGPLLYNLEMSASWWWVVPVLLLTALSLAGAGMLLGLLIESTELVGLIANLGTFLMFLASPVFLPLNTLPLPLQILSFLLPPSYASDALRHALLGTVDWQFYFDLTMLLLITTLSFWGINRFLRWRLD